MAAKYKRFDVLKSRRTGVTRTVVGFTTKPDGVKRARLADDLGGETKVRVEQIGRNYSYA